MRSGAIHRRLAPVLAVLTAAGLLALAAPAQEAEATLNQSELKSGLIMKLTGFTGKSLKVLMKSAI